MIQYISYPLELFSAAIVFSLLLEKREHGLRNLVLYMSAFFLVFIGSSVFTGNVAMEDFMEFTTDTKWIQVSSLFWCTLLFFISIGLVWCYCEVPLREAIYCATCAYLMEHIAYCIRLLVNGSILNLNVHEGSALYYIDYVLVYFVVYYLFSRHMVQNGHYVTGALDSISLMISVLLIVMVMSIFATQYGFEPIHGVYALICCIYALYGQLAQQRKSSLQRELVLQKQLWQQQKNQYEISRSTIDIINHKCHDLKHQIAALRAVEDSSYRKQIIDSLQESVMIYDSQVDTGNEILNTVLTEKSLLCQQKAIHLHSIVDGTRLSFMDPVDLYTLFGNAMDNAIEAVQKLPEAERQIRLTVREKSGLLLIRFENPYAGYLTLKDGMPLTSKDDNNYHGFGVGSIRMLAEKYHGIFMINAEDGYFRLQISIPLL